jgi:hypothetical protein
VNQKMKRNVKAINRLADFIENARYEFNMASGFAKPTCGTAGCIGGHAAVLWPSIRSPLAGDTFSWDSRALAEKLEISEIMGYDLCMPTEYFLRKITRPMAVAALRRLAKTSRVHFSKRDDR